MFEYESPEVVLAYVVVPVVVSYEAFSVEEVYMLLFIL
ncbi:hypothetical protein SAMD00020551_4249 [Mesobacillus selenatarsenatis SF-1]|uniref:Uncharacterized protein n=1 Tax=Mesobacillus selenatarsenatis (strain DSM 18680 / JCM 14380 / FERM P-15431 / SF-1) TaxID=1321606 RepID=A0A0A8XD33_MESS1|nr:hypothetical protein SAMD00020551_4249 [Mesobacillus selenatarsenatis SF-1]